MRRIFLMKRLSEHLLDPHLAFPEAYMDGDVEMEAGSFYDFLSLFAKNLGRSDFPSWMRLADAFRRRTRFIRQTNNPEKSKRNVSHHYDLPGSLYELFLDKDKQYSCAYFENGTESLDEAQLAKNGTSRENYVFGRASASSTLAAVGGAFRCTSQKRQAQRSWE